MPPLLPRRKRGLCSCRKLDHGLWADSLAHIRLPKLPKMAGASKGAGPVPGGTPYTARKPSRKPDICPGIQRRREAQIIATRLEEPAVAIFSRSLLVEAGNDRDRIGMMGGSGTRLSPTLSRSAASREAGPGWNRRSRLTARQPSSPGSRFRTSL